MGRTRIVPSFGTDHTPHGVTNWEHTAGVIDCEVEVS
jgi:hypothetical protein